MSRTLVLALLVVLAACDRRRPTSGGSAALAANLAAEPERARVVLGAPDDPALAALLARLAPGVRIDGPQWVIGERRWSRRGTLLVAVFEDPDRPGLPLTLAVAAEPERRAEVEPRLVPGWRPALELWQGGTQVASARLSVQGVLRAATLRDVTDAPSPSLAEFEQLLASVAAPEDGRGRGLATDGWDDAVLLRAHVAARPGVGDGTPWRQPAGTTTLEGDTELLVEMARVRAAGRRVALECVLLSSPTGTFDGERVLTGADQWVEHLAHRARAVRHVGSLAERAGADLFLVGGGTPEAATTVWGEDGPSEEERSRRGAAWDGLIAAAREVFHGPLGYRADSPRPAQRIGFWDRLDVALFSLQRPAPDAPAALRRRFTGALAAARAFAQQRELPWMVTAEGFPPATLSALVDAWSEAGGLGLIIGGESER